MADQAAADAHKVKGNEAYKKRDFATAISEYTKAYELHKDITYLNNLAAAYFESGDLEACVKTAEQAIEDGREQRADFKIIAKSFGRIGTAYAKQLKWDLAIKNFQKSLTEHRTPEILAKLKEAEKAKAEAEKLAYIDPELSQAAREKGNALFKAGDFAGSVKEYEESIKRDPSDARGYANKSAALTKLLALPEALKDAEKAIEVDPSFVKGYIRKSHVYYGMKEYSKAAQAIEEAAKADKEGKNTKEIGDQLRKINMADASSRVGETDEQTYARAMRDPEIAKIMSDPVFVSILQQAQSDPKSLNDHMKNPDVRIKIEKLAKAGIIKTGR